MSDVGPRTGSDSALDHADLARAFSALAQPSRLALFLQVAAAGPNGAPMESLAGLLNTTGSALTLHVRALEAADLVEVRVRLRPKRSVVIVARVDRCAQVALRLADHCRQGGWRLADAGGPSNEAQLRARGNLVGGRPGA